MKSHKLPSARLMRALVHYDPETGHLFWKPRPAWLFPQGFFSRSVNAANWNAKWAGRRAFASPKSAAGHLEGSFLYFRFSAHRVAWVVFHGAWPEKEIDHINQNAGDNRIANLRDVSHGENMKNRRRDKRNSSGITGVSFNKKERKWVAQIGVKGRVKWLGASRCIAVSSCLRAIAEKENGFSKRHGRAA